MYSMDFEEFIWAKGYESSFVQELLVHMEEQKPFREVQLDVLILFLWITVCWAACPPW